ncbi:MAG: type II toxin-antitoxin system RelE/ParE family toxin [Rhodopirellula sp.]|nr:type II toxin-antitoxin system RelE/ParE family toxin [Rhodopirellula sp.]
MPQTVIQLYREDNGDVPVELWLDHLEQRTPKAWAKCIDAILELERLGHEARRPLADALRDGIYELRTRHQHINYRLLYFFNGQNLVVLSHGITKKDKVPAGEINRAIKRRKLVEENASLHIAIWEN